MAENEIVEALDQSGRMDGLDDPAVPVRSIYVIFGVCASCWIAVLVMVGCLG